MIKFCQKCQDEKRSYCPSGYYFGWKESVKICPNCGGNFIDIDFPPRDLAIIQEVSQDVNFIEAMIKLRQDDIIEYESRMSQFRMQAEQKEQIEQQKQESSNQVKCPTCGSTNVQKIGAVERTASVIGLGIFSKKINKSFKCKNCGYTW